MPSFQLILTCDSFLKEDPMFLYSKLAIFRSHLFYYKDYHEILYFINIFFSLLNVICSEMRL